MRGVLVLLSLFLVLPAQAEKKSATPNRFGAIAYHRATQSWGIGYDKARERDASVEALKLCGQRECEVIHKFKNGCAALADGPKTAATASGATRDEAETKVMKRCNDARCKLIAWACTR